MVTGQTQKQMPETPRGFLGLRESFFALFFFFFPFPLFFYPHSNDDEDSRTVLALFWSQGGREGVGLCHAYMGRLKRVDAMMDDDVQMGIFDFLGFLSCTYLVMCHESVSPNHITCPDNALSGFLAVWLPAAHPWSRRARSQCPSSRRLLRAARLGPGSSLLLPRSSSTPTSQTSYTRRACPHADSRQRRPRPSLLFPSPSSSTLALFYSGAENGRQIPSPTCASSCSLVALLNTVASRCSRDEL